MRTNKQDPLPWLKLALTLTMFLSTNHTWACDDWLAKTVAVSGAVERQPAQTRWQPLPVNQVICPGDRVRVAANSRAALYLRNNTFMRLNENSIVYFPPPKQERGFWLEVNQGLVHFISRIVDRFEVSTPYVNAVVEGTEFIVSATPEQASVTVLEGQVKTSNKTGTVAVDAGHQIYATSRSGEFTRLAVKSQTGVEWAIFYPPVLTLEQIHDKNPDKQRLMENMARFAREGRPDLALQMLPADNLLDTHQQVARASLLLAVGKAEQAEAALEPLLKHEESPLVLALLSISASARNKNAQALAFANRAIKANPNLAAGHIARSYAQQARLQLQSALESATNATLAQPDNAVAWLRLSELQLVSGDLSGAEAALKHARTLTPDDIDVANQSGFIALFLLQLDKAEQHFRNALTHQSSHPQTRLGLGLTLLRKGELDEGRQQLEYAVSLDPSRSALRSYLGRAYFEEKRDSTAGKQWDLAKTFDPKDPTAYFYEGVQSLFANDPIDAIRQLESARDLTPQRAVYRSETLLQSDTATRSATVARAYGDVGFDQIALLNGSQALHQDATNAGGHRLLADRYASLPRHEAARVSELLQSQLWQPLTAYPLQPQLSESNLAIVKDLGPERPGLNEYHSLFTQNGVYTLLNTIAGSDNTWGDDAVVSALHGPLAFSVGQYHYDSDGFRDNADQQQDVYNGFAQWQLTPGTSLQFEARQFEWERGDLGIKLIGQASDNWRSTLEKDTLRLGMKHQFNPENAILVSAIEQTVDETINESPQPGLIIDTSIEQKQRMLEFQHVANIHNSSIISGIGSYRGPLEEKIVGTLELPPMPPLEEILTEKVVFVDEESIVEHENIYSYWNHSISQAVSVLLGLSYNSINNRTQDEDQWSPKLGLTANLTPNTLLRAAAFRTLKRDFAADQTIEPTQIAGFNQFLDDINAADAKNYGIALDSNIALDTWIGISSQIRKSDYPVQSSVTDDIIRQNQDENWYSAYWYHLLTDFAALRVGYDYQKFEFEQPEGASDVLLALQSHRVPFSFRFFPGQRLSFAYGLNYYNQRIESSILDIDTLTTAQISERKEVWVSNVSLEYKLPKRFGALSLGVENLTDKKEEIAVANTETLDFYPARFIFARIQLSL